MRRATGVPEEWPSRSQVSCGPYKTRLIGRLIESRGVRRRTHRAPRHFWRAVFERRRPDKNKFSELLDRVERGVITRRGKPVTELIPFSPVYDQEQALRAAEGIHQLAKRMNLGTFDWEERKGYRDTGRR